jgi:hypothetical protein
MVIRGAGHGWRVHRLQNTSKTIVAVRSAKTRGQGAEQASDDISVMMMICSYRLGPDLFGPGPDREVAGSNPANPARSCGPGCLRNPSGRWLGVASAVCGIPHGWLNRLVVVE